MVSKEEERAVRTSHTSCLGGLFGPGGSVVVGSCTRGSRAADDGDSAVMFVGGLPNISILVEDQSLDD
jgi:hypothetical protein